MKFGRLDMVLGRVGQNRLHTPYMTVRAVFSLLKNPYIHRICV